jgi:hypothetical protein
MPLALVLVSGCVLPGVPRPDGQTTSFKPGAGPRGTDAIGLEVAVLELPIGDRFANSGLWATIDEQVVALDHKAALDDNGFRVGVIGGVRPTEFDDLLKSLRSNPDPHWHQMRAGHAKVVALGGRRPICEFHVVADGKPGQVTTVERAQCALQVTPTLAADGGVKLAFVPVVQHGVRSVWSVPSGDDGEANPAEMFPALGWEVTAAAGEFVVIGTYFQKAGTLGHTCFVDPNEPKPVQRLLAIRAVRANSAPEVRGQETGNSKAGWLAPDS